MIKVDIVTSNMNDIHGANRVTEMLIKGQEYFKDEKINLRYVYTKNGIINCFGYSKSVIGANNNSFKYKFKRSIISFLKKIPLYKTYLFQKKIALREINSNRKTYKYYKREKNKADVLIFQDPFTAIYFNKKKFDGKSIFISHADTDPLEQFFYERKVLKNTGFENWLRKEYNSFYSNMSHIVTICESSKKYMYETYGLKCSKIINGMSDYYIADLKKYSDNDGKIHLCIVGSLQYRKGQDLVVEALAKLDNIYRRKLSIHFFGYGNMQNDLIMKSEEYELKDVLNFHGAVTNVEEYLQHMNAFLLPSRSDTVPMAIIEAMRAGLPVFATNVGEVPYMIENCGVLIEASKESLIKLFIDLVDNRYDLVKMSYNARKAFLNKFQLSIMIKDYARVVTTVMHTEENND